MATCVVFQIPVSGVRLARDFQRKAQFLADFIEAENSMGFHAPKQAARVRAKSIDSARRGQVAIRQTGSQ